MNVKRVDSNLRIESLLTGRTVKLLINLQSNFEQTNLPQKTQKVQEDSFCVS